MTSFKTKAVSAFILGGLLAAAAAVSIPCVEAWVNGFCTANCIL